MGEAKRRAAAEHSPAMIKAARAAIRLGQVGPEALTLGEALALCPYRTILAFGMAATDAETRPPEIALVMLEGDPSDNLPAEREAEVIGVLKRGGTVLLAATNRAVRDAVKARFVALCRVQPGGRA